MPKIVFQTIAFIVVVGVILLGEKFGYKKEAVIGVMSIVYINVAFSLYRLNSAADLSESFLKSIYALRGRREAILWGWLIWLFTLVCFVLVVITE